MFILYYCSVSGKRNPKTFQGIEKLRDNIDIFRAMSAYSLPYPSVINKPSFKRNTYRPLQVKAQGFRDEGRLSKNNIVDANMRVLKERIEKVQMKERLEKCCRCEYGWNYAPGYDYKHKRDKELGQFFHILGLVGGTITFTCLSGTILLCLLSILTHLSQH